MKKTSHPFLSFRSTSLRIVMAVLTGIILFVAGCFAVLVVVLLPGPYDERHYDPDPYIDTVFTDSFSWDSFNRVKIGMSREEVLKLLGEPFRKNAPGVRQIAHGTYRGTKEECWEYSHDGKMEWGDKSWYSAMICFYGEKVSGTETHEYGD